MITQADFERLIKLEKQFEEKDDLKTGPHPIKWTREIVSLTSHDTFLLDFTRSSIELKKYSVNKRFRTSIVLLRYCSHGIHTNPDGKTLRGSHVHMYQEGFDDKIAYDPSHIGIKSIDDIEVALGKLLQYINVKSAPLIQSDLF